MCWESISVIVLGDLANIAGHVLWFGPHKVKANKAPDRRLDTPCTSGRVINRPTLLYRGEWLPLLSQCVAATDYVEGTPCHFCLAQRLRESIMHSKIAPEACRTKELQRRSAEAIAFNGSFLPFTC